MSQNVSQILSKAIDDLNSGVLPRNDTGPMSVGRPQPSRSPSLVQLAKAVQPTSATSGTEARKGLVDVIRKYSEGTV